MNTDELYLTAIYKLLMFRFREVFGSETMEAEPLVICNCPEAQCSMLVTSCTPVVIRLAQQSLSYWAQTIFQLSHEMCHFAIRQHKADKDFILKWFEEIVCEAASLYFLEYSAKNWMRCELYTINREFDVSIRGYLDDELRREYTDDFQKCDTLEKMRDYNKIAEEDRCGHRDERNRIYRIISENPTDLGSIVDYDRYVEENGVLIDFTRWIADCDSNIIRAFAELVPVQ